MKKLLTVLGLIASALALILSVLPISNLAYIPAIAALVLGVLALIISKENQSQKKTIQLVFLLTIIALSLTIYKSIFTEVKVGNTKELDEKEEKSVEEAIEVLDNDELLIEPIENEETDNDF